MNKLNTNEIKEYGDQLINTINKVRFNQGFRGYDTAEIDDFLDDLMQLIEINCAPELSNQMIKTDDIINSSFSKGFRGYNSNEVDSFLKKISTDIEKLNEIKRKFI